MARDAAGLDSPVVVSAAILVDTTPPEGVTCSNYSLKQETSLTATFTSVSPLQLHMYTAEVMTNVTEGGTLLMVEVMAEDAGNTVEGFLQIAELKMPFDFGFSPQGIAIAEHEFLSPYNSPQAVRVVVEAQRGAAIIAKLSTCVHTESSSDDAVTLQQISPNVLSVCSRIHDQESGVKTMMVAVGTTPSGLQVQPWTEVGYSGHVSIDVHVQHATPMYATVVSQNQAGDWSRFTSRPIVWDRTGPSVSEVTLTLRYEGEGRDNVTEMWAEGRWTAEDAESGLVSCSCHLGLISPPPLSLSLLPLIISLFLAVFVLAHLHMWLVCLGGCVSSCLYMQFLVCVCVYIDAKTLCRRYLI